jgi:hypothetical protein
MSRHVKNPVPAARRTEKQTRFQVRQASGQPINKKPVRTDPAADLAIATRGIPEDGQ